MTDEEMVTIPLETLRHLYDLAAHTPLETPRHLYDVVVLRATADRINVDPMGVTPDEFVCDFPHPFVPATVRSVARHLPAVRADLYLRDDARRETDAEVSARYPDGLPDQCSAGSLGRLCGRPRDFPQHVAWQPR